MSAKVVKYNEEQWHQAQEAVLQELEDFKEHLRAEGVDYTIKNARQLLIYLDLSDEWNHKLKTVISDLEENPFALSVFTDIKREGKSTLLSRAFASISKWPDFNPTALALWLELEEDVSL